MKIVLPLLLLATLGILTILPNVAAAHQGRADDSHHGNHGTFAVFAVHLSGDQQVPPVSTSAFGFILVRLFHNGTSSALNFRLIVCNIANVTNAHIHVGTVGTNGPGGPNIVVHFFDQSSNPVSKIHGCTVLASGTRGPADLTMRPNAGINSWEDFVNALLSGNTYVNVHTIANPNGEIRGQLVSEETE